MSWRRPCRTSTQVISPRYWWYARNVELRTAVEKLIQLEPIPGKALEGGNRLDAFRNVLLDLTNGRVSLEEAYAQTERALPRAGSPHANSNQVFAQGWGSVSCAHNSANFTIVPPWRNCVQQVLTGSSCRTRQPRSQTPHVRRAWLAPIKTCRRYMIAS
jgi:hypothetical protein